MGIGNLVQNNVINNAATAEEAIRMLLSAPSHHKMRLLRSAHRFSLISDLERLLCLNQYLTAGKCQRDISASIRMGHRLLKLAIDTGFVQSFRGLESNIVDANKNTVAHDLHHSAVFGWLAGCAGLSELDTLSAYLQNSANCLLTFRGDLRGINRTHAEIRQLAGSAEGRECV